MRKLVTWNTPKYYQNRWKSESSSNPAKLPKTKSKYCKKLRGPHQFGSWKNFRFAWNRETPTAIWEQFCVKCNKKNTWLAPTIPGPYWETDYSARPPGYMEGSRKVRNLF